MKAKTKRRYGPGPFKRVVRWCAVRIGKPVLLLGLRLSPFVLAVAVLAFMAHMTWEQVTGQPKYQVDLSAINIVNFPSWCTPKIKTLINESVSLSGRKSIFDRDLTAVVGRRYYESPWVDRLVWVRKAFPNTISVRVQLREPGVAVRQGGRYYVVDQNGVRLPLTYTTWPVNDVKCAFVTGISTAPPAPGKRWDDPAIADGIAVLDVIAGDNLASALNITTVDLSNHGGRRDPRQSEIVLITEHRAQILWGRSPNAESFGELSVEQKLAKLDSFLRQNPNPANVNLVVRFPDGGAIPQ